MLHLFPPEHRATGRRRHYERLKEGAPFLPHTERENSAETVNLQRKEAEGGERVGGRGGGSE